MRKYIIEHDAGDRWLTLSGWMTARGVALMFDTADRAEAHVEKHKLADARVVSYDVEAHTNIPGVANTDYDPFGLRRNT